MEKLCEPKAPEEPSCSGHSPQESVRTMAPVHQQPDIPICESCSQRVSKYCCPGCGQRSCSLDCVKGELFDVLLVQYCLLSPQEHNFLYGAAHKAKTGCSGKRDRTAYVGRGQWDERHLLSGGIGAVHTNPYLGEGLLTTS